MLSTTNLVSLDMGFLIGRNYRLGLQSFASVGVDIAILTSFGSAVSSSAVASIYLDVGSLTIDCEKFMPLKLMVVNHFASLSSLGVGSKSDEGTVVAPSLLEHVGSR
jgi:hypothetical protein